MAPGTACGPTLPDSRAVPEDDSSRPVLRPTWLPRSTVLEDDSSQHADDCGPHSWSLLGAILPPSPQSHNRGRSAALPHQPRPPPPRRYHTAIPRGQLQVPQRGLACNEGLRRGPEWTSAGRDFQSGGKAVIVRGCSPSRSRTRPRRKPGRQESPWLAASKSCKGKLRGRSFSFFCLFSA